MALCCCIPLTLAFSCNKAADACPDLEKLGASPTPYSIPELTNMIRTLDDSSATDDDTLNKQVMQALSDAQALKKIEQGGPGDVNKVENDLSNKLMDISNLCSQIVSSG